MQPFCKNVCNFARMLLSQEKITYLVFSTVGSKSSHAISGNAQCCQTNHQTSWIFIGCVARSPCRGKLLTEFKFFAAELLYLTFNTSVFLIVFLWHITFFFIINNFCLQFIFRDIKRAFKESLAHKLDRLCVSNDGGPQHGWVLLNLLKTKSKETEMILSLKDFQDSVKYFAEETSLPFFFSDWSLLILHFSRKAWKVSVELEISIKVLKTCGEE